MGCFLTNGFVSHLPICEGDPIYGFLCIKKHKNLAYEFLTPVYLPIKGTYDEYGKIHHIEYTPVVKLLEELAGFPIDRIIELVYDGYRATEYDNNEIHDDKDREDFKTLRENLKVTKEGFRFYPYDFDLCMTLEHCEVIDTLSNKLITKATKSYDTMMEDADLLNWYHENWMNKYSKIPNPENPEEMVDGWMALDGAERKFMKKLHEAGGQWNRVMNVDPMISEGYYGNWRSEFNGHNFLHVFRQKEHAWMLPEFKEPYCRMLSLYMAMFEMGLCFTMSLWQGQDPEVQWTRKLVASYNRVLRAQNARRKRWDYG